MQKFRIWGTMLFAVGLMGCGGGDDNSAEAPDDNFGEGKLVVSSDAYLPEDAEEAAAMKEARETFDKFVETSMDLDSAGVGYVAYVMVQQDDPKTEEVVMVDSVEPNGDGYKGMVSMDPTSIKDIAMGDEIQFKKGHVVEWRYIDEGKVVGAHHHRVIRSRMSEAELKADNESIPFEW